MVNIGYHVIFMLSVGDEQRSASDLADVRQTAVPGDRAGERAALLHPSDVSQRLRHSGRHRQSVRQPHVLLRVGRRRRQLGWNRTGGGGGGASGHGQTAAAGHRRCSKTPGVFYFIYAHAALLNGPNRFKSRYWRRSRPRRVERRRPRVSNSVTVSESVLPLRYYDYDRLSLLHVPSV